MFNLIESIAQFLVYSWCFGVGGGYILCSIVEGILAISDHYTGHYVYRG